VTGEELERRKAMLGVDEPIIVSPPPPPDTAPTS